MKRPHLTRLLTLESPSRLADGAGGFSETWNAVGALWAELRARTGSERSVAGAAVSRTGYRILVRGAPTGSTMRPTPDQRFRDGARTFVIRAVAEHDPTGRFLICFADEEVAA